MIHHPVVNKNGETIASAVTNLDIHDIARVSLTYGVKRFYVVTPLKDQAEIAKRILSHWTSGAGSVYNPDRKDAMDIVRVVDSIETIKEQILEETGLQPLTIATCAKKHADSLTFGQLSKMAGNGKPCILSMGTAWGLSPEFLENADYILEPVNGTCQDGQESYNHLSVRSATSIILDRLTYWTNCHGQTSL